MKNREILFRGKRVDNGEWVYGGFVGNKYICTNLGKVPDILCNPIRFFPLGTLTLCEVIPETVGQFIGLTDNNGTKIFEGDLVEVPDYSIGIALTFKQPTKIVKAEYRNGWNLTVGLDFKGSLVTGNIHEHPTK